jgi:hypothetical protein
VFTTSSVDFGKNLFNIIIPNRCIHFCSSFVSNLAFRWALKKGGRSVKRFKIINLTEVITLWFYARHRYKWPNMNKTKHYNQITQPQKHTLTLYVELPSDCIDQVYNAERNYRHFIDW